MEKKEQKQMPKGCAIASFIFCCICIIGIVVAIMIPVDHNEYDDLSICVQVLAGDMIESKLRYPDGWSYEIKQVDRKDSTLYDFHAVVLAKNGFGVRSKLNYSLRMRFIGNMNDSYKNATDRKYWLIIKDELRE
jgi:hypothetical protein